MVVLGFLRSYICFIIRSVRSITFKHRQFPFFAALTQGPVLQYPHFTKPFVLTTDASGYAVGAILNQGKIGQDKPIAYASRTLNQAEQNYSTIEKELTAIVWARKHFRLYLLGRSFTIVTDHKL